MWNINCFQFGISAKLLKKKWFCHLKISSTVTDYFSVLTLIWKKNTMKFSPLLRMKIGDGHLLYQVRYVRFVRPIFYFWGPYVLWNMNILIWLIVIHHGLWLNLENHAYKPFAWNIKRLFSQLVKKAIHLQIDTIEGAWRV